MTKAQHIMTKAPHIMTKAPHIMTKAPHIMTKAPHIMTKAPHIMTKAPHIMTINYLRQSWLSNCSTLFGQRTVTGTTMPDMFLGVLLISLTRRSRTLNISCQ